MNYFEKQQCPTCGHFLNTAVPATDRVASRMEGDAALCCYCGELLEFTEDLRLIKITPEAFNGLRPDQQRMLTEASAKAKANRANGGLSYWDF